MHASSNLLSMRTKKLVQQLDLCMYLLCVITDTRVYAARHSREICLMSEHTSKCHGFWEFALYICTTGDDLMSEEIGFKSVS